MSHWYYQLERYRDYNLYLLLACLIVDVTTNRFEHLYQRHSYTDQDKHTLYQ